MESSHRTRVMRGLLSPIVHSPPYTMTCRHTIVAAGDVAGIRRWEESRMERTARGRELDPGCAIARRGISLVARATRDARSDLSLSFPSRFVS